MNLLVIAIWCAVRVGLQRSIDGCIRDGYASAVFGAIFLSWTFEWVSSTQKY